MEVREHDEPIGGLRDDLQLELFLLSQVVNGRTTLENVKPHGCVERNEVRSL